MDGSNIQMVKIKLGTNTEHKDIIVSNDKTAAQIFAENNIDISRAQVYLDGAVLDPKKMNTKLVEMNIDDTTTHTLIAVVKATNA